MFPQMNLLALYTEEAREPKGLLEGHSAVRSWCMVQTGVCGGLWRLHSQSSQGPDPGPGWKELTLLALVPLHSGRELIPIIKNECSTP